MEWPAANAGWSRESPAASRRSRRAARYATDVATSAGWALRVRSSSSAGPSQARRESGSPRAASASAKTAAALGDMAATVAPIPGDWDPWPGKTSAIVAMRAPCVRDRRAAVDAA